MISKFDKFCEGSNDNEKRLNWIIDKISNLGETSLTAAEKEFLNSYKDGNTKNISSESDHYNKFILSLLKDLKENNIKEEDAKKFITKFINKDDMFEFVLTLFNDGKLDFLLLNDLNEDIDLNKDLKNKDFKTKGFWDVPIQKEDKPKRYKGKFIRIPNFNKY